MTKTLEVKDWLAKTDNIDSHKTNNDTIQPYNQHTGPVHLDTGLVHRQQHIGGGDDIVPFQDGRVLSACKLRIFSACLSHLLVVVLDCLS